MSRASLDLLLAVADAQTRLSGVVDGDIPAKGGGWIKGVHRDASGNTPFKIWFKISKNCLVKGDHVSFLVSRHPVDVKKVFAIDIVVNNGRHGSQKTFISTNNVSGAGQFEEREALANEAFQKMQSNCLPSDKSHFHSLGVSIPRELVSKVSRRKLPGIRLEGVLACFDLNTDDFGWLSTKADAGIPAVMLPFVCRKDLSDEPVKKGTKLTFILKENAKDSGKFFASSVRVCAKRASIDANHTSGGSSQEQKTEVDPSTSSTKNEPLFTVPKPSVLPKCRELASSGVRVTGQVLKLESDGRSGWTILSGMAGISVLKLPFMLPLSKEVRAKLQARSSVSFVVKKVGNSSRNQFYAGDLGVENNARTHHKGRQHLSKLPTGDPCIERHLVEDITGKKKKNGVLREVVGKGGDKRFEKETAKDRSACLPPPPGLERELPASGERPVDHDLCFWQRCELEIRGKRFSPVEKEKIPTGISTAPGTPRDASEGCEDHPLNKSFPATASPLSVSHSWMYQTSVSESELQTSILQSEVSVEGERSASGTHHQDSSREIESESALRKEVRMLGRMAEILVEELTDESSAAWRSLEAYYMALADVRRRATNDSHDDGYESAVSNFF